MYTKYQIERKPEQGVMHWGLVQKGFTIIELMIALVIVAILASIAVPIYQDYTVRARVSEAFSVVSALQLGVEDYYVSNNEFPVSMKTGDSEVTCGFGEAADCSSLVGNSVTTRNISSVRLADMGQIQVLFDTSTINQLEDANELLFVPMVLNDTTNDDGEVTAYNNSNTTDGGGSGVIRWKCVSAGNSSLVSKANDSAKDETGTGVSFEGTGVASNYVPQECRT